MSIYPGKLRCEYKENPVIDSKQLRFNWQVLTDKVEIEHSIFQTAYRLMITEDITGQLVFDSEKRESDEVWCDAEISELQSDRDYTWKIQLWDQNFMPGIMKEGSFSTGILNATDWRAKWIEPKQKPAWNCLDISMEEMFEQAANGGVKFDYSKINPCKFLRKDFVLDKPVKRAKIFITAHGIYRLEINGICINPDELAPGNSTYERLLPYQTYDVTGQLNNGANVVGIVLADGWYAGHIGCTGDSCQYGDLLAAFMQLHITYEDGTEKYIVSDESFYSSDGPLVYSDLFLGEKYDARQEISGWSQIGYNIETWEQVHVAHYSLSNLVAQCDEEVGCIKEIPVIRVIRDNNGDTILDFGQVIAGRVRMLVSGDSGTEVTLEHSETLDEHGNFFINITGVYKDQVDHYILKGDGIEEYEPWFTYHGFRYVRVTGYPGEFKAENFTARVLSTKLEQTGTFFCSNENLNRLQQNIYWSLRGNTLSIPTDCPQRERAGWTGDVQVITPTACFNLGMASFLKKYLKLIEAEQKPDGAVPIVIPFIKAYQKAATTGLGEQILPDNVTSAGWGDVCTFLPWYLFEAYGDVRILRDAYPVMKKWLAYIASIAENFIPNDVKNPTKEERERQKYLWNTNFHFGDWVTPSVCIDPETGCTDMERSARLTNKYIPTLFYAASADITSRVAHILGYTKDSATYETLSNKIKKAFREKYIDDQAHMPQSLQGMYVLGLKFKFFSPEQETKAVQHLVDLIVRNDYRLDTGFMSMPHLLDILFKYGHEEAALKILYQEKCPSWLYEVNHGATTIWETWETIHPDGHVEKDSMNHYAFGCVGKWMYEHLLGIQAQTPGYKTIRIRPLKNSGLKFIKGSYESIYGKIAVSIDFIKKEMQLEIPYQTEAEINVPGELVSVNEKVWNASFENGYSVFALTGGKYRVLFQ